MTATTLPDVALADASEENPWARAWRRLKRRKGAMVGLVIVVLLVLNYPMLVGETDANGAPAFGPLSVTLLALLVPFIVTGLVQAAIVKRRNPEAYARIVDFDA